MVNAQVYIPESDKTDAESIFSEYVAPSIDKSLLTDSIIGQHVMASLCMVSYVVVGRDRRVQGIISNPLYSVGNNLPNEHILWEKMEQSVIEASRSWKFKPLQYDTTDIDPYGREMIESGKMMPPNSGRQYHIILWIFDPFYGGAGFDKIYAMDVDVK